MDKKYINYAINIRGAIGEIFNENSDWYIDPEELMEGDNLTYFIHALSNVAPTDIYNQLTSDNKNQLEFNHVANQLCFQYLNRPKED